VRASRTSCAALSVSRPPHVVPLGAPNKSLSWCPSTWHARTCTELPHKGSFIATRRGSAVTTTLPFFLLLLLLLLLPSSLSPGPAPRSDKARWREQRRRLARAAARAAERHRVAVEAARAVASSVAAAHARATERKQRQAASVAAYVCACLRVVGRALVTSRRREREREGGRVARACMVYCHVTFFFFFSLNTSFFFLSSLSLLLRATAATASSRDPCLPRGPARAPPAHPLGRSQGLRRDHARAHRTARQPRPRSSGPAHCLGTRLRLPPRRRRRRPPSRRGC